tara:strand:+ start:2516 stop:4513 length:1998 start_codon:yes stop_codon:yes gene_type:complete
MATTIRSTALDFNNIKSNLKTYLANSNEFKDYNFEASGLSNILDVLAYNTHINGLIANFALNESYLPTAQLRSSMVSLAEGVGYVPDTNTASQAKVRITFNNSNMSNTVILPAYTKFDTTVDDVSYTFQTIEAHTAVNNGSGFYEFKTAAGSNQIPIFEGTLRSKTFLVGEYEDNPVYVIPDRTIDADTVTVNIFESATSTTATPYQNILNATSISANSTVYILKESPNEYYDLSFGDGTTFGIAPAAGNRIEIQYLSTNGAAANGASVFTASSAFSESGQSATLSVTKWTNSIGGDTKETIESIRKNAPFQYATQNRMVTAEDYASLILRNYSTLINDIVSWGGEDALNPEFGAVYVSIDFEDDVTSDTIASTKLAIQDLSEQLSIASFNLRFVDPVQTFVETDTFFQFNPKLTDLTLSSSKNNVSTTIENYFTDNTGKFKQSFRRSNLLSLIDDVSGAVLSSRANVRMQQRFIPSSPSLISVIKSLLDDPVNVSDTVLNHTVNLVTQNRFEDAANYLDSLVSSYSYTFIVNTLSKVKNNTSQQMLFPVAIAVPDDDTFTITSSTFVYEGNNAIIKNKLSSSDLQIVAAAGGTVLLDNIGNYNAASGTVTVNYFNPTSITGGVAFIKLAAIPANQSVITSTRNDVILHDPDRSSVNAVITEATN